MRALELSRKLLRILATEGVGGVTARVRRRVGGATARIRRSWRVWTFRPHLLDKRYGEVHFRFYVGNSEGQEYYRNSVDAQKPIEAELAWLASATRGGDVVADVGAHHGYFALLFGSWVGQQGKVFAFECLPENARIAVRNVQLNKLGNVQVVQKAVGARAGTVEIANNSGGIRVDRRIQTALISVEMLSLDGFFSRGYPDLLKIDVEGWELEVLRGARTCLAHRPKIALEFHCFKYENRVAEARAILDLLPTDRYEWLMACEPGDRLVSFSAGASSAAVITGQYNPHIYGMPIERGRGRRVLSCGPVT